MRTITNEELIGKRIRQLRVKRGMTQAKLAEAADISITQLSGYENGNIPSLSSLAKLARALETTLDELYFGDETESFISSATDKGHLVVNCLEQLYKHGIIRRFEFLDPEEYRRYFNEPPYPYMLTVTNHPYAIRRLLANFSEIEANIRTYEDPQVIMKEVCDSVAKEING